MGFISLTAFSLPPPLSPSLPRPPTDTQTHALQNGTVSGMWLSNWNFCQAKVQVFIYKAHIKILLKTQLQEYKTHITETGCVSHSVFDKVSVICFPFFAVMFVVATSFA